MRWLSGLLASVLCCTPLLAQKKAITLETLNRWRLASRGPGLDGIVWAPGGEAFLFRQSSDLMLYEVPRKKARRVLDLAPLDSAASTPRAPATFDWENRRVKEQTLQWSSSGREVLYATSGDLFWIEIATGKYRQLTSTTAPERDPKLSPDGKQVAFLRDWDLFCLDISNGHETRLTSGGSATLRNGAPDWVYPEELELGSAYWWAPDSHAIAYLQFDIAAEPLYPHEDLRGARAVYEPQRYPQAGDNNASIRLGVVDRNGGESTWLDLGDTAKQYLIPRAGWLPDSKRVYVMRSNRVQNQLDFLSFDVASGNSVVVDSESDKFWVNVDGDPVFLNSGNEFLITSERDGGREIYRRSPDGAAAVTVTSGGHIDTAIVCANESQVFFTAAEDPAERQFYSASLNGSSAPRRITKEPGSHHISMAPGCRYFLDEYSNLASPPVAKLKNADGSDLAIFRRADTEVLSELDVRPTELLHFQSKTGETFYARLIKPPNFDPAKKYPAIVHVYGGPHAQSVRNSWPGVSIDQVFAHAGFVVWEMDNRGTSGRGHRFESPVYRNLGQVEVEDQRAGIQYLLSLGFVDASRIGVNGWSYGGFMTLNLMLSAPDLFKAGFAGAPVTNWLNYDTIYTERYMGLPKDNAAGYARTSLISKAANLQGKLMIAHNLEDDNVLFQNTLQMIHALETEGKQFDLALYTQKTHGVGGTEQRQMEAAMLDFFTRNLLPASSGPVSSRKVSSRPVPSR